MSGNRNLVLTMKRFLKWFHTTWIQRANALLNQTAGKSEQRDDVLKQIISGSVGDWGLRGSGTEHIRHVIRTGWAFR